MLKSTMGQIWSIIDTSLLLSWHFICANTLTLTCSSSVLQCLVVYSYPMYIKAFVIVLLFFYLKTWKDSMVAEKPKSPLLNELNNNVNDSLSAPKKPATIKNNVFVKSKACTASYSIAMTDSCGLEHSPPKAAFVEQKGFDDPKVSFRNLYKSLFGHSVERGFCWSRFLTCN